MKSKKIKLKNCLINTYHGGKGKPLFLIPGWPFSGRIYFPLIKYLADDYQVTTLDLPGWAGNSKLKADFDFQINSYVELILVTLKKIYSDEVKISLGGVSIGGTLALLAAYHQPELAKNLVIHSSPWNGIDFKKKHKIQSQLISKFKNKSSIDPLLKRVYKGLCLISHRKRSNKKLRHLLLKDYKNLNPYAVMTFADNFFNSDFKNQLKQIKIPVLAVGSTKDQYISCHQVKHLSQNILPQSKYFRVPYSHYFVIENPKMLADIIKNNL